MKKFIKTLQIKSIMVITLALIFVHGSIKAQIEYNEVDYGVNPMPYSRVGTAGYQYLKLPTNARTAALGNITSVLSSPDANALLTNPAAMADIDNYSFSSNYMSWVAETEYISAAVVKNLGNSGAVGLSLISMDYGDMPRTEYDSYFDPSGNLIEFPVTAGLGTVTANDLALGLSYARTLYQKLKFGFNMRYLKEQLDDANSSTVAMDFGSFYMTGYKSLRISILFKLFGADSEFRKYEGRVEKRPFSVKTPMAFSFGTAMDFLEDPTSVHRLTVAAEYTHPNDGSEKYHLGLEYGYGKLLFLRAGHRFNYQEYGWTAGAGAKIRLAGKSLFVDWAIIDVGRFNIVQMISLSSGI